MKTTKFEDAQGDCINGGVKIEVLVDGTVDDTQTQYLCNGDIKNLAQQENSLMKRYFSPDIPNKINLLDEMKEWIDNRTSTIRNSVCRNNIIHHLLEIVLTTDDLKEIAERGNVLCRDLSNRANNYKRMVERHKPKE